MHYFFFFVLKLKCEFREKQSTSEKGRESERDIERGERREMVDGCELYMIITFTYLYY